MEADNSWSRSRIHPWAESLEHLIRRHTTYEDAGGNVPVRLRGGDRSSDIGTEHRESAVELNQVMRLVNRWAEDHGLDLATQKTELLLITGKWIP